MGNIGYYRDNLLAQKLLPYIFWISQGGFLSFDRTAPRRVEHATPSLFWSERYEPSFFQECGRRIHRILTQSSICSVLQEKVYPSKIANVDELKTRLIDEWEHFHQSIVDATIA